MARTGTFDPQIQALAWFDAQAFAEGWFADDLIPPASTGITGDLTVTLADVTLSADGTVANGASGDLNVTLADATLAADGTITQPGIIGDLSVTLGAVTLSADGTVTLPGITGDLAVTLGALSLSSSGVIQEPQPVGGGGPGNAQRGRKRAVYMVDDKVFDRAEDAARYLASVTAPEPEDAQEPTPRAARAAPVAAVEIEGERMALGPIALPVSATPAFVADMVQGELQAARRKLQARRDAMEREEMAAVMAAMKLLLDDGEEIVFH